MIPATRGSSRSVAGTQRADQPHTGRARRDHRRQPDARAHLRALARHRARQLLRWRSRLLGFRHAPLPAHRAERLVRRPLHAAALGDLHVSLARRRTTEATRGSRRPADRPRCSTCGHDARCYLAAITSRADSAPTNVPDQQVARWTPLAKDGAELSADAKVPRLARQQMSMGETYDFEFVPERAGHLRLELRRGGRLVGIECQCRGCSDTRDGEYRKRRISGREIPS